MKLHGTRRACGRVEGGVKFKLFIQSSLVCCVVLDVMVLNSFQKELSAFGLSGHFLKIAFL